MTDGRLKDAALMERVATGDNGACRELVDQHLSRVVGLAHRMLGGDFPAAEEVAQEAFFRLWKQAAGWRPEARVGTWLFRVAHNLCIDQLRSRRRVADAGHLALRDAFFNPSAITEEGGIAPLLRGLAHQAAQAIDPYVIVDVRNFLFANVGGPGFDLVSLNIQRGRDHGLPGYNDMRRALGLEPATGFADVSRDEEIGARLAAVYEGIEDVDLWVGGLAEDPLPGGLVGELIATVMKRQFQAMRDGDRFWYRRTLDPATRTAVERTRLSDIIRRNTAIGRELRNDVLRVPRGTR